MTTIYWAQTICQTLYALVLGLRLVFFFSSLCCSDKVTFKPHWGLKRLKHLSWSSELVSSEAGLHTQPVLLTTFFCLPNEMRHQEHCLFLGRSRHSVNGSFYYDSLSSKITNPNLFLSILNNYGTSRLLTHFTQKIYTLLLTMKTDGFHFVSWFYSLLFSSLHISSLSPFLFSLFPFPLSSLLSSSVIPPPSFFLLLCLFFCFTQASYAFSH